MKPNNTVYAQIIGQERENDSALKDCRQKLKKVFGKLFVDREFIDYNTTIYLIGHGDTPMRSTHAKIGNKTPKQVSAILKDILISANFGKDKANYKGKFRGKIILQACHSAEIMMHPDTIQIVKEIDEKDNDAARMIKQYLQIKGYKLGTPSFLYLFIQQLLTMTNLFEPEVIVGGYLGSNTDSDFTKTGYSSSQAQSPETVRFQNTRKMIGKQSAAGIISNEQQQYEVSIKSNNIYGKV